MRSANSSPHFAAAAELRQALLALRPDFTGAYALPEATPKGYAQADRFARGERCIPAGEPLADGFVLCSRPLANAPDQPVEVGLTRIAAALAEHGSERNTDYAVVVDRRADWTLARSVRWAKSLLMPDWQARLAAVNQRIQDLFDLDLEPPPFTGLPRAIYLGETIDRQ